MGIFIRRVIPIFFVLSLTATACYRSESQEFEISIPEQAQTSVVVSADGTYITSLVAPENRSIIREIEEDFYLHDYSKGFFETNLYFDLCWCVEFLEHVDALYADNYFDTFKKCRYVFCTFAPKGKGGYHHVNTQDEAYWIETFEKFDFKYQEEETKAIRASSTINKNFIRNHGLLFKNNFFK